MTEKRFTDVWCSEIGHIGITDNGIDKEFTGSEFEDFLNKLSDENEQLKKLCSILKEKIQFYEDQVVNPECPICHTILREISIDSKKDRYYRICPKCGYEREESLI